MAVKKEQLFEWYDFCLQNNSTTISLEKFILSPQEKEEAEKKQLKELENRVKLAQEEFEKALKQYKNK